VGPVARTQAQPRAHSLPLTRTYSSALQRQQLSTPATTSARRTTRSGWRRTTAPPPSGTTPASTGGRAGLADTASGVSFESYSGAGRYLRHYDYLLYTQPADTTLARADATFYAE
jgi:hypothetical protein